MTPLRVSNSWPDTGTAQDGVIPITSVEFSKNIMVNGIFAMLKSPMSTSFAVTNLSKVAMSHALAEAERSSRNVALHNMSD